MFGLVYLQVNVILSIKLPKLSPDVSMKFLVQRLHLFVNSNNLFFPTLLKGMSYMSAKSKIVRTSGWYEAC